MTIGDFSIDWIRCELIVILNNEGKILYILVIRYIYLVKS